MGEIFIFETRTVGGSVSDHPVLYLCQKQNAFSVVRYSYLIRKVVKIEDKNVRNSTCYSALF